MFDSSSIIHIFRFLCDLHAFNIAIAVLINLIDIFCFIYYFYIFYIVLVLCNKIFFNFIF